MVGRMLSGVRLVLLLAHRGGPAPGFPFLFIDTPSAICYLLYIGRGPASENYGIFVS